MEALSKVSEGAHLPEQLNLKNHCIICLKKQQPSLISKLLKTNGGNFGDLKPLFNYLTGKEVSFENEAFIKTGFLKTFPLMCKACHNGMSSLNALHQQLVSVQCSIQIQTELLRERVNGTIKKTIGRDVNKEASSTSARERFKDFISNCSGMPESEARKAFDFISELHDLIIAEGKGQVTFPSKLKPLPFTSLGLSVTANLSCKSQNQAQLGDPVFANDFVVDKTIVKSEVEEYDDDDKAYEDSYDYPVNNDKEDEDMDSLPMTDNLQVKKEYDDDYTEEDNGCSLRRSSRRKRKLIVEYKPSRKTYKRRSNKNGNKEANILKEKTQLCDLCKEKIPRTNIEEHMRSHVKDYAVQCICPSCPRWYSCIHKMELHMNRNQEFRGPHRSTRLPENFMKTICPLCDLNCKTYRKYRKHLDDHQYGMEDEDKPYECPISGCNQRYLLKEALECHIFFHRNVRAIKPQQQCTICKGTIPTEEMEHHLKDSHQISEPIPCKFCKLVFADRLALLEHIPKHRDEKGIPCDLCPDDSGIMKFRLLQDLQKHYATVHNIDQPAANKGFPCERCPSILTSLFRLKSHQARAHPDVYKPNKWPSNRSRVTCELCHESFRNNNILHQHKIKVHGADPFKCKLCPMIFESFHLFRQHERQHKGILKEFKCEEEGCGQTFSVQTSLDVHQLKAHSGVEKPFKCDYPGCNKGYWIVQHLNGHQLVHEGIKRKRNEKRKICEECGESLSSKWSLKVHMLIHTGERPFSCHICGQTFRQQEVMDRHIQSHETKGDSFKPKGPMKNIRKRVERSETGEAQPTTSLASL